LTPKGVHQSERIAEFLKSRLPPDARILVSPALRAQQTARALTDNFDTEPAINVHATPQAVLNAAGWPTTIRTTLLVGHQPWLGEVAALIMTGKADCWRIKKGSVWWFSRRERNGDIQSNLRLVISPDQL
jgi:phosphohistidine phosphatase